MSRPAALLPPNPRFFLLFATAELMLAMAVPFLAIKGYHTILGSQAGVVVDEPKPGSPGWSALVEPTELVGVAEVSDGRLTGLTVIVVDESGTASSVVLGPGEMVIGDRSLGDTDPEQAVAQVASELRLRLTSVEIVDEAVWAQAFGPSVLAIDNPDPVTGTDGTVLFDVGAVDVSGAEASQFLGIPSEGATLLSLGPRRHEFWSMLSKGGLAGNGRIASLFPVNEGSEGSDRVVFDLPIAEPDTGLPQLDTTQAEQLLRTLVPFPAGSDGTDRLRIRIVDGHGQADLESLARQVAARGLEVVEISTAATFTDEPSQLIVPIELSAAVSQDASSRTALDDLEELASELDIEQLVTTRSDDQRTVSLVVGSDFDIVETLAN